MNEMCPCHVVVIMFVVQIVFMRIEWAQMTRHEVHAYCITAACDWRVDQSWRIDHPRDARSEFHNCSCTCDSPVIFGDSGSDHY